MKRGATFELALEIQNKEYANLGKAWVVKTDPKVKKIGGRLIYAAKSSPDFIGGIAYEGRLITVAFEAKEVAAGDRFSFTHLPEHQAKALDKVAVMCGVAFVVVRFQKADETRLYGWGYTWALTTMYWEWFHVAKTAAGRAPAASVQRETGRVIEGADWLPLAKGML